MFLSNIFQKYKTKPKYIGDLYLPFYPNNSNGIIFGSTENGRIVCLPDDKEGHIFVNGGSGTGKTSAILIPTLDRWYGSSFTVDISGDIVSNAACAFKRIIGPNADYTSHLFAPYNVFASIDDIADSATRNQELELLTYILMPDQLHASDAQAFFTTEGRKILTAAFIAFYRRPHSADSDSDFCQICKKIFQNDWRTLFNEIDAQNNEIASGLLNSFLGTNEKNTAGCKQAVDAAIKLFATNEAIQRSVRRSDDYSFFHAISPKDVEHFNIFLIIKDANLEIYAPLMQLITGQMLHYLADRDPERAKNMPILLCLDEFASLGKLDITPALRKLRKKNVHIMLLTQSLADIDLIYGRDERMSMMNNFGYKVILSASDTDTQRYFADLIGQKTIFQKSETHTDRGFLSKKSSTTFSETKDYIIEPADLAHLGNKLILIHPQGYLVLAKNYYFDSILTRRFYC